jgi:hypothetical protein
MQVGIGMSVSRCIPWLATGLLVTLLAASAWANPEKESPGQAVDSGSFGVFMNGKRVATETFSIHQGSTGSTVTSRFKTEANPDTAEQSSELQLTAAGELKSYEWKEISPGQSQATVLPSQDFLTERYGNSPTDKQHEQPFLLPASTSILDDYFFVQREVLAWKYFATSCKQEKGGVSCPKEKAQLGTLNAHSRASGLVNVQFSGREKIAIHGAEHELIRLDLKTESGDWTLWLDDQLKLQRIVDSGNTTEVVRD